MLLLDEAAKLSIGEMESGVIETIVTTDDLFAIMPFKPIDGKEHTYNRENTISEADFVDVGETITEGAATVTPVTVNLKRIIGDVDVDEFIQETMSNVQDQTAVQVQKKIKGLGNKFRRTLVTGDSAANAKQFDGFNKLCPAGQKLAVGVAGASAALALTHLDALIDMMKVKSGQRAFIMNTRTLRSFYVLARASGGNTAEMLTIPGVVGPVPSYRGVPIIANDYVPITEDSTDAATHANTRVTLASLDENEGLAGITSKNGLGVRVVPLGIRANKDAKGYRVKWYVSLILNSTLAIAQAIDIND